ncbi:hypothetical protein OSTOST_07158 [Ostertagia ostertagi]
MYEYRIYVRFIYCIPSCVLYVFVLIALFKEHKGVPGRFYSLLIVQALLNVLVFVNSFYVVQMANITNESNWWSGIYNRTPLFITSIIWSYGFPSSVAITLLTPFWSVYPLLTHSSYFIIDNNTNCFDVTSTARNFELAAYFFKQRGILAILWRGSLIYPVLINMGKIMSELFIFLTVLLVATSLVNCVSVILLFIRSKRYHDKAERNMFILAFLDFLIQVTFYILFALIYKRADNNGITDFLVPYASDVVTFSNAYLLIILNKKIRRRVSILVKCRGLLPY